MRGGNFVAQLTAIHHTIFAPSTIVGRATPVSPPGTRQGNVIEHGTFNPSKLPRSSSSHSLNSLPAARKVARLVHHSDPTLAHKSLQVGTPRVATTPAANTTTRHSIRMGVIDKAISQLGESKSRKG